jgi:hypothetical protein
LELKVLSVPKGLKEAVMKKCLYRVAYALYIAALLATFGPTAKADESNKLTYFTFSQPVELPGNKVLPAGTYAFKLMDSAGDRNIVQVFNKDLTMLYATILTIPDYRPQPHDKTIVKFSETAQGGPEAIKEWFYPGDQYGQEFVYPKSRATEIAKESHQSVPSMPTELSGNITQPANNSNAPSVTAMKDAQLKSQNANGQEASVQQTFGSNPANNSNNRK